MKKLGVLFAETDLYDLIFMW